MEKEQKFDHASVFRFLLRGRLFRSSVCHTVRARVQIGLRVCHQNGGWIDKLSALDSPQWGLSHHQTNGALQMRLLASFLALTLSTSAVLAADVGPLSPGAPAGVKRAQASDSTILYVGLGAAAIAGIAIAASSGDDAAPTPAPPATTTTTTTTTV